jgi:transcriptional regulator with XRE-family HTH domain
LMDMAQFGARLKEAWEKSGLSQEAVVGTSMSIRTFQRLMDGQGNPTLQTISALSLALNVPVAWLLGGPREPIGAGGIREAIQLLAAFDAMPPGLKAAVLSLIYDDEEYLSVFGDPGMQRKAARKLHEVREAFEP